MKDSLHPRQRGRSLGIRLVCVVFLAFVAAAPAQNSVEAEHGRKVVYRVVPAYPDLARQMRITGTVRLVAVVAPSGAVKVTEPVGGNPLLLKSAEEAVRKWKYVSGTGESKELVELHFGSQ